VQHGLHKLIYDKYKPLLERVVDNRGMTVAIFTAMLILTIGLMTSGIARVVVFPEFEADFIQMQMEMQAGSPAAARDDAAMKIQNALLEINEEHLRENPDSLPVFMNIGMWTPSDTGVTAYVELPFDDARPYQMKELTAIWRERVGELPGLKDLRFISAGHIAGGSPISFRLNGNNMQMLEGAAEELAAELAQYDGLFDIVNSSTSGTEEIKLAIKPEAEALGLTMSSLGRQVRQAFYGEEVQRLPRADGDVRVMVRYPQAARESLASFEDVRIRTPDGRLVPLLAVAEVEAGLATRRITRRNGERVVTVRATVEPESLGEINRAVKEGYVPELIKMYPGLRVLKGGSQEAEAEFFSEIASLYTIALFVIYALIAVAFRSYSLPLLIMTAMPFG